MTVELYVVFDTAQRYVGSNKCSGWSDAVHERKAEQTGSENLSKVIFGLVQKWTYKMPPEKEGALVSERAEQGFGQISWFLL